MPTTATPKRRLRQPKLEMTVQNAGSRDARNIPTARKLRAWAQAALRKNARVTLRIVNAREGRKLNRAFRGKDYATNVLTFVYDARPLSGDIALCAPVIAREARAQKMTLDAHYAHLVVHGMLHLQGYDHERNADAQRMEALEVRILKKLGYANPYEQ